MLKIENYLPSSFVLGCPMLSLLFPYFALSVLIFFLLNSEVVVSLLQGCRLCTRGREQPDEKQEEEDDKENDGCLAGVGARWCC